MISKSALLIFAAATAVFAASSVKATEFKDSRGNKVKVNLGELAFADRPVIASNPSKLRDGIANPANAVGQPNYKAVKDNGTYYSMGCEGSAVWEFTDNTLSDVPGDDLYLFEVGPDIEPTMLEISINGFEWRSLGEVRGGKASVDISSVSSPGEVFRFVRLTDLGKACKSRSPGADIDAIAATGGGITFRLDSAVLFDVDSADLKPAAQAELKSIANEIKKLGKARISVAGHTDADGSDAYNLQLSQARAQSVVSHLTGLGLGSTGAIQAYGRGESAPIADNTSAEGKARNRRVEITVVPAG